MNSSEGNICDTTNNTPITSKPVIYLTFLLNLLHYSIVYSNLCQVNLDKFIELLISSELSIKFLTDSTSHRKSGCLCQDVVQPRIDD